MTIIRPPGTEDDSRRKPERKAVVTRALTKKKDGLWDKISRTFLNEDGDVIKEFIIFDVLIPQAKDMLVEMVKAALEMAFWGGSTSRGSRITRDGDRSRTSYQSFYKGGKERQERRGSTIPRNRSRHNFSDVVIPDRAEAEEVLSNMVDLADEYGSVTVADFYDLVGLESLFTDNSYGWEELGRAEIRRVRGGYVLDLPRPVALN